VKDLEYEPELILDRLSLGRSGADDLPPQRDASYASI